MQSNCLMRVTPVASMAEAPQQQGPLLVLLCAEPLCVPVQPAPAPEASTGGLTTAVEGPAPVLMLHLKATQFAAAAGAGAATATSDCYAGSSEQSPGELSRGETDSTTPSSSSGLCVAPTSSTLQQPQLQLLGLLYDGSVCIARYCWPVPLLSQGAPSSYMTAAAQLVPMTSVRLLQLVLVQAPVTGPAADTAAAGTAPSGMCAIARCPVLFLPAAAVEEVHSILQPAMLAELQQRQQQQPGDTGGLTDSAPAVGYMSNETIVGRNSSSPAGTLTASSSNSSSSAGSTHHAANTLLPVAAAAAAWAHWQALADDIGQLLGLGQLLSAAGASPLSSTAAHHQLEGCHHWDEGHAAAGGITAAAAAAAAAPRAADGSTQQQPPQLPLHPQQLLDLQRAAFVQQHVVPLVLGFLASQGMRHCHDAVVEQLPPAVAKQVAQSQEQQQLLQQGAAAAHAAAASISSSSSSRGSTAGQHSRHVPAAQPPSAGSSPQVPAVSSATPWLGFAPAVERRFLRYKHQQHLWLDRYAAGFAVLWLCVLLARMTWERDVQGSLLYFGYILCKALPYVTLLVGRRECFQRHREVMIAVVSQLLCLSPIILGVLLRDPVTAPLFIRACSRTLAVLRAGGRALYGHAQILSGAWPLLAAARQQPLWSAALAAGSAVDGAMAGFPAAAMDLHQHLTAVMHVPEPPMRVFWKMHGEYLVLVPMAIPQHTRLRYFVPSMLLEVAGNCYVFTWVFPPLDVLLRFMPALLLTVGVAWWYDLSCRQRFVQHLQLQEQQKAQQLAAKLHALQEEAGD